MKTTSVYTLKTKYRYLLVAGVLIAGICSSFHSQAQHTTAGKTISQKKFQRLMKRRNIILVDVRTAEEYKAGHIPGAIQIDVLNKENFTKTMQPLDRNKKYLLYCRSGKRSNDAKLLMKELGFTRLFDLKDGFSKWTGPKE